MVLAALLFVLSGNLLAADKYKVIKVIGSIVLKETGAMLASGDVILASDAIVFKTPNAKASVVSSQSGRLILTAGTALEPSTNVKSNLLPPMANISSRAGAILNYTDLRNHFAGKFLLLEESYTQIHKGSFPMHDSSFFYLTYSHNGEAINKRLKSNNDTLLILERELFRVDGRPISYPESTAVKMSYMSGKTSLPVADFEIVVPENKHLVKEVQMILDASAGKSKAQVTADVLSYLGEFYGKTDADNVQRWLKKNFKSL